MAEYPNLDPPAADPLDGLRQAITRMDEAVRKGCRWIAPLVPKEDLRTAMDEVHAALKAVK